MLVLFMVMLVLSLCCVVDDDVSVVGFVGCVDVVWCVGVVIGVGRLV